MKSFCIMYISLLSVFLQPLSAQKSEIKTQRESFQKTFKNATFQWKEGVGTPHRVICDPIKLAGSVTSKIQLEHLLRGFIKSNKEIFHIENFQLKVRSIHKAGNIWYANFIQIFNGVEVLDSEIIFRVHENGNLFVFGFDYYKDIGIPFTKKPNVTKIQILLEKLYSKKSTSAIKVSINDALKILPLKENGKTVFKTVQIAQITNSQEINDVVFVDILSSKIIKTIPKTQHLEVTGNAKAEILPTISTDPPVLENLEDLTVVIDGNEVLTDEFGNFNYTIAGSSANLSSSLSGAYVTLENLNLPNAFISQTIQPNEVVNLVWDDSNSDLAERNVFYHINKIHKHNKVVDPNFTNLDYPLQCIVNDTGSNAPCNAFWNGTNLHFGVQASGCAMNSAHGASVIYHEYGHAINDRLYNQLGLPFGLQNPILHEAFSDIYACLLVDDPRFALGWYGPGTFTRNLNNNNAYPISIVGQQHTDGLILGGAFWDLRLLTSSETAYELAHFAKYGTPDDSDIAVAFSEVYLETLIADDDDGNLLNGTPNSNAIENAFCQHGIGSNLFATQQLIHAPHQNTLDTTNDYQIEITLPQSPFISQSLGVMDLVYTTNNFNTTDTVPFSEVNATTYQAFIPSQEEGTLIKYYFSIPDGNCGSQLQYPSRDFFTENYSFYIGEFTTVFEDDFESDMGWQLGDPTDNATSGFWGRGNPQQTVDNTGYVVQPENDYSQNGVKCLVTGASQGTFWYSNDVDGGKTTVTSPVFDNLNETSIIEFYKWFVHGAGFTFPANGEWKMEITNNGTNWIPIEITNYGDHRRWINAKFKISDLIAITNQIQVRFVASDFGAGSIVEALIDDFKIVTLDASLGMDSTSLNTNVILYPNPVSNTLFITSENINIEALKLYSITGKKIKEQKDSTNSIDVSSLSNGMYFLEIISEKGKGFQKFIKR